MADSENSNQLGPQHPDDATIRAWALFVRTSQTALAAVEAELKASGFPPLSHYDALLELRRAQPAGLRAFEVQERMLLAQYNTSRLLARLVKVGQVNSFAAKEDGRGRVYRISLSGEELLRRMWPVYAAAIQTHFGQHLDAESSAALLSNLRALSAPRSSLVTSNHLRASLKTS